VYIYFLINRVCWDFKTVDGTYHNVTESFYARKGQEHMFAEEQFGRGHYAFTNGAKPPSELYSFELSINSKLCEMK